MPEPTPYKIDDPQLELEEWSEAVDLPKPPEPLAVGTLLQTPDGTLQIDSFIGSKGVVNLYGATLSDSCRVSLCETEDTGGSQLMHHEFEVLHSANCPMFPQSFVCWDDAGRTYLANEPISGMTLGDAFDSKILSPAQVVSVLAQVAYALSQLHSQGWVHLAIRPSVIVLSKPVRILDFVYATRKGERRPTAFYFSGYSAPELLADGAIDMRADVYAVGALLFHALSGYPIAESGPVLTGWQPESAVAGVPQILHRCLGPIETRYGTMAELHSDLVRLAQRCTPRIRYEGASATTIGLEPTRTVNQDAHGFSSMQSVSEGTVRSWALATVADGMGGMAAGELASAVAVDAVLQEAMVALFDRRKISPEKQAQMTVDWVRKANEDVCDLMNARQVRGGCTLDCALVVGKRLTIAHVGDCRTYLIRDGSIQTLTRDHSVAMSLVMQGDLDINQLREFPDRSNVTRSLGDCKQMPGHYVDTLTQTCGKESIELQGGDILLLCSDGLWEPVIEDAILEVLAEGAPNLEAAADRLLALAIQKGAPDNATVSLLRIDEVAQTES